MDRDHKHEQEGIVFAVNFNDLLFCEQVYDHAKNLKRNRIIDCHTLCALSYELQFKNNVYLGSPIFYITIRKPQISQLTQLTNKIICS